MSTASKGVNTGKYEPCWRVVEDESFSFSLNDVISDNRPDDVGSFAETVLEEAGALVDGPREATYGHPHDDFAAVTRAAEALGVDPMSAGPLHHALYMVLVKIQRLVQTPGHRDSVVDGAGYFRTYEKVMERIGVEYFER